MSHFITFEGGEGAGKSVQSKLCAQALQRAGRAVVETREPGGAPGAEQLRQLLLFGAIPWAPLAETMLHFAARAEHVEKRIRPALAAGQDVVCDRFYDSTMAYQGFGQQVDRAVITRLAGMIGLVPDLTIILDVAASTMRARLAARGGEADRYEREAVAFQNRVGAGFRAIAAENPRRCVMLSGEAEPAAVHRAVMDIVHARFGDH